MSIVVDLAELAEAMGRHSTAYLLLSGDERPHVGEVDPQFVDGVVVVPRPGRTARRVIGGRPAVSLLFPPHEAEGYSLVVDGHAELAGEELHVIPSSAVLHRRPRADSAPSPTGCEGDCKPLTAS